MILAGLKVEVTLGPTGEQLMRELSGEGIQWSWVSSKDELEVRLRSADCGGWIHWLSRSAESADAVVKRAQRFPEKFVLVMYWGVTQRIHCAAFLYPDTSVSVMLGTANGPTADSFRAKNTGVVLRTVLNKDGAFSKILARYDEGPSSYVLAASDGSKGGGHYPFPLLPFFELSPDGSHAVLVTTRIHGSDSALAAVVVLNARGDTVAAREIAIDGVPIPRQVVDSAISGVVSRMPSRALAAEYARQVYVPAVYPPVVNVRVGNNGDVWIKLYSSGPSSQYRILRVSGEIMSVSGPSELDLLAVSDEVAWGVIVDDVGVPSLVRLRIRS